MADQERWDLLAAAPTPEDAVYQQHMAAFVHSFVVKSRRDRWLYQLSKRPARVYASSHKIYDDLDRARCSLVKDEGSLGNLRGDGIYYEFRDEPKVLSVQDALAIGSGHDAIFSLVAGKVAVFFFHEDEIWLCQA
jgi:hypothetical protein